jgi:hypothetical protein
MVLSGFQLSGPHIFLAVPGTLFGEKYLFLSRNVKGT